MSAGSGVGNAPGGACIVLTGRPGLLSAHHVQALLLCIPSRATKAPTGPTGCMRSSTTVCLIVQRDGARVRLFTLVRPLPADQRGRQTAKNGILCDRSRLVQTSISVLGISGNSLLRLNI